MGTKVQFKSYLPGGYYPMTDLNDDSNSASWSLYYGDKTLPNGQSYDGFFPRTVADIYRGYDKDVVKQTMLKHEAIFRNQVYELHRVYRLQRDLMSEIRSNGPYKHQVPMDPLLSTSRPMASQILTESLSKWLFPSFTGSSISSADNIPSSHLSFTKGTQSRGFLKDCEVLGFSRPSKKVRRKTLDLQLPVDEYIETEEWNDFADKVVPYLSSSTPGNRKAVLESDVKLFLGPGCQQVASSSSSCLRSTKDLGDLNEPIQVEETSAPTSVDFLGRAACRAGFQKQEISAKPTSEFWGLPKEIFRKSHHESDNGTVNNQLRDNKVNCKEWFSYVPEAGPNDRSNGDFQREKDFLGLEISKRSHGTEPLEAPQLNCSSSFIASSDMNNSWSYSALSSEKQSVGLSQKPLAAQKCLGSSAGQNRGISRDNFHLDDNAKSNPGFRNILPNRNGSYRGSSLGSKEQPVWYPPVGFDYMNYKNFHNVTYERFISYGSANHINGPSHVDVKSEKDMAWNVVLSSSSSKGVVPPKGLEVFNEGRKCEDCGRVLPWMTAKPAGKNETETSCSGMDLKTADMSSFKTVSNRWSNETETGKGPDCIFTLNITPAASSVIDDGKVKRIEKSDHANTRKILGVPVFEKPVSKNGRSSFNSPSLSLWHPNEGEGVENNETEGVPDINLPSYPMVLNFDTQISVDDLVLKKGMDSKIASFRDHIDLNSCASEEEASLTPYVPICTVKATLEIDLEAPVVPETEFQEKESKKPVRLLGHGAEDSIDELTKVAAEVIVAISLSRDSICNGQEASLTNTLHWFVEVALSGLDDLGSKCSAVLGGKDEGGHGELSSRGMDYFEFMTLRLRETDVKEYPSNPQISDGLKTEEMGTASLEANQRHRKGLVRRGRQRRDFQRDILPGLASLSRHEVTEDLQTFGGLMKAVGHSCHSGPTRSATRNGCTRRGRPPRLVSTPPTPPTIVGNPVRTWVQQLNNIEVVLERRSLIDWGKTTRRPRGQRCPPPGNLPPLPLA